MKKSWNLCECILKSIFQVNSQSKRSIGELLCTALCFFLLHFYFCCCRQLGANNQAKVVFSLRSSQTVRWSERVQLCTFLVLLVMHRWNFQWLPHSLFLVDREKLQSLHPLAFHDPLKVQRLKMEEEYEILSFSPMTSSMSAAANESLTSSSESNDKFVCWNLHRPFFKL